MSDQGADPEALIAARETALKVANRLANRMLAVHPGDVEDFAQEATLRISQADPFPDNPDAWITTATTNIVLDSIRRRTARPEALDGQPLADSDSIDRQLRRDITQLASTGPLATSQLAMRSGTADYVWQSLAAELTDQEIRVMQLVALGYSQREIAEHLGYKDSNVVKATLFRARRNAAKLVDLNPDDVIDHPRVY